MARYYVPFPVVTPEDLYLSEAEREADILEFREALRRGLDPDGLHTNWMVGDIAKWSTGFGTASGYGFGIYHMSGGSPTGPAWFWAFPGWFSNTLVDVDDILEPARTSEYYKDSDGGSLNDTFDGVPAFHYSETGGTLTPYDFGYDVDGLLPGGDFSAPNTSPLADLDTFMPALNQLYGWVPNAFMSTGNHFHWAALFDDTKPFSVIYTSNMNFSPNALDFVLLSGKTVVPFDTGDSDQNGSHSLLNEAGASSIYFVNQLNWAYNDAGTRTLFDLDFPDDVSFKYENVSTPALLLSTTYLKGNIDPDILRTIDANQQNVSKSFVDGGDVFLKGHRALGYPYASGSPLFPHIPLFDLSTPFYDKLQQGPLAANVVAHYSLNEVTGTSFPDQGPNRYLASAPNGATLKTTTGVTDGVWAVSLNGVDQFIDLGEKERFDYIHQTGRFTVSVWVNIADDGSSRGIAGNSSGNDQYGFFIEADYGAGFLRFRLNVNPVEYEITTTVPGAGWHHLALTSDGTTMEAYLDSASVGTVSIVPDSGSNTSTELPSLGALGQTSSFFNDALDEATFFNRGLTSAEVLTLYNLGV